MNETQNIINIIQKQRDEIDRTLRIFLEEIERLKKSSCHVFRVTNGDVLGTCYAFYDFFDVYWDDGTSNLALTELSVYGIRKTCQDT